MLAGAGADVDDPVARPDRLLVVLDDDHRVPEVAQPGERVDEPAVVALVQPDRRFVEHVERADQSRPDLAGEPDALRLAARQRPRRAGQREVVEPDVEQEPEAGVHLFGDPLGDQPLAFGQLEAGEELRRLADGELADLGDVALVDRHREAQRLEPGAPARRAGDLAHVALELLPRPVALGVLVAPLDPRDHAFVARGVLARPAVAVLVLDGERPGRAVQDHLLLLRRQGRPRRVHVDAVGLRDGVEHAGEVLGVGGAPRRDRALVQRLVGVGDDQLGVDLERRAQAVARLARPVRGVEREVARRQLLVAPPAHRARQVLAERERLVLPLTRPGDELDLGHAVGEAQRRLQRVGEPAGDAVAPHESVDDDLDLVLLVAGEALVALEELVDVDDLAVDARPHVALPGEVLEQGVVLALAPTHDRGEHLEAGALGQQHDAVDDLLGGLPLEPGAVVRAVLGADAGVQQAQVVVDLGDRADGRAGVAAGRLLVDRDRRGQPVDDVDVGLVHLPEELAGVRRQRLDVPPLALGVDRVEGEARLARARQAREHDQPVARQLDVDVPEVVLAGPADADDRLRTTGGHQPATLPRNDNGGIPGSVLVAPKDHPVIPGLVRTVIRRRGARGGGRRPRRGGGRRTRSGGRRRPRASPPRGSG